MLRASNVHRLTAASAPGHHAHQRTEHTASIFSAPEMVVQVWPLS